MSRNFRSTGGRMALENIDGADQTAAEIDIDNDTQHGDGADQALVELQGVEGEVGQNDADIAELENTAVALESLLETAEASQETGGLDPVAAELLQKAVENETAPLGTPAEEVVPALENFTSASDRRRATVMACEGIGEWIDKVWAKIKELIQKGRDLAKKAYVAVKQFIQRIQPRIKALQQDLGQRNFSMPKAGNVKAAGNWDFAEVGKVEKLVNGVLVDYTKAAIAHANSIAAALNAGDAAKAAEGEDKKEEAAPEFKVPTDLARAVKAKLSTDLFQGLPGGRVLAGAGDTLTIRSKNATESGGSSDTKPVGEAVLKGVLDTLEKVAAEVVGYEKNFQEKDRAQEGVIKAGDAFAKKAKANDKANDGDARKAVNAAKDAGRLLDQPAKDVLSYAVQAINGYCGVVAAHLKHYDKK